VCMFNVCNLSCGLPCYNPPGCVFMFPSKLCGFGLTCPYFCFSCGFKHCCRMPEEERAYWRSIKESKKTKSKEEQESKEDKLPSWMVRLAEGGSLEGGDIEALRDLHREVEMLRAQVGKQHKMDNSDAINVSIEDGPTLLGAAPGQAAMK